MEKKEKNLSEKDMKTFTKMFFVMKNLLKHTKSNKLKEKPKSK